MHLHQILGKKNGGLSKDDINYLTPPLHFYYFYFETVNFHDGMGSLSGLVCWAATRGVLTYALCR